jgi:LssY C-terminus
VLEKGAEGRPVWLGSATLDRSVGLSYYTGQITHHIDSDIDMERSHLIGGLVTAHMVNTIYTVSGIGPTLNGRNGEAIGTTPTARSRLRSLIQMQSLRLAFRACLRSRHSLPSKTSFGAAAGDFTM